METKINFRKYIGTKSLLAFPMNKGDYCKLRNRNLPDNEEPEEEGYLVEYPDSLSNHPDFRGYISWSPKNVFEEAYNSYTEGCTFGQAIELLKSGHRMARKGWNGIGMYITYVPAEEWASSALERPWSHDFKPIPWIGLKTTADNFVPWMASQSDILAEDWVLAE